MGPRPPARAAARPSTVPRPAASGHTGSGRATSGSRRRKHAARPDWTGSSVGNGIWPTCASSFAVIGC